MIQFNTEIRDRREYLSGPKKRPLINNYAKCGSTSWSLTLFHFCLCSSDSTLSLHFCSHSFRFILWRNLHCYSSCKCKIFVFDSIFYSLGRSANYFVVWYSSIKASSLIIRWLVHIFKPLYLCMTFFSDVLFILRKTRGQQIP